MIDIINSFVVVLRQKDDNSGWLNSADETLEQRYYYCQNWRADVAAIVYGYGMMMEWVSFCMVIIRLLVGYK